MLTNRDCVFSMSQAKQNFSQIANVVDKTGEAVILKENKPHYLLIDIENENYLPDLTDDEKIEIVAKRILKRYLPAFKELAK